MRHFGQAPEAQARVPVAWRKLPAYASGNAHLSTDIVAKLKAFASRPSFRSQ